MAITSCNRSIEPSSTSVAGGCGGGGGIEDAGFTSLAFDLRGLEGFGAGVVGGGAIDDEEATGVDGWLGREVEPPPIFSLIEGLASGTARIEAPADVVADSALVRTEDGTGMGTGGGAIDRCAGLDSFETSMVFVIRVHSGR